MTTDLYNTKDTTRIRELLLKEQEGLDLLTGLPIPEKQAVTDHKHDSEQFVRGVLHRQSNASLGKLEGIWTRYLSYWYPYDLPTFLRQAADYIEKFDKEPDTRYRHPNWQKRIRTDFNKLSTKQMKQVLETFGKPDGKNLVERKKMFASVILDKSLGYDKIRQVIDKVKNDPN
jgi:hypothetical protein